MTPTLGSIEVHTNQKLNNITQAQVDVEPGAIAQANARSGLSEYNDRFMYTNATRGWRESFLFFTSLDNS